MTYTVGTVWSCTLWEKSWTKVYNNIGVMGGHFLFRPIRGQYLSGLWLVDMTEPFNQAISAISNRILMLQKANMVYSMSRLSLANVCPPQCSSPLQCLFPLLESLVFKVGFRWCKKQFWSIQWVERCLDAVKAVHGCTNTYMVVHCCKRLYT